jgi:hypothetical protein
MTSPWKHHPTQADRDHWEAMAAVAENTGTARARLGHLRAKCLIAAGHATGWPEETLARLSPDVTPLPDRPQGWLVSVTVTGDSHVSAGQGVTGHWDVTP